MIKTIILDFDGTMADTRDIILKTMRQTIDRMGFAQPDEKQCIATIGLPLKESFMKILGVNAAEGERCTGIYRELFDINNRPDAVPLFDGVAETISQLHAKGLTVTIASSRGHKSLAGFVERFQLADYIKIVLGADDVAKAKPDPEPVLETLRRVGVSANETLVVGDTPFDIVMGLRAGTRTCGVTYGNEGDEE